VNSVSRRYRKALSGAKLSTVAFDSINASARPESVRLWSAEEEHAQRERGHDIKVMDIYDIKMKQRESGRSTIVLPNIRFQSLPVQKYSLN
jgi:hypothetical protein